MKKIISISLIVALLISFCPSSFGAPSYNRYADMEGRFNRTYLNDSLGVYTGFEASHNTGVDGWTSEFLVSGEETSKKSGDDYVWKSIIFADSRGNSNWNRADLRGGPFSGYGAGDKVYLRAQYYIPDKDSSGVSYSGYNDSYTLDMQIGLDGTTVKVITLKTSNSDGGIISVNGSGDNAITNVWKYNTWHTVEAIVTFGSSAKMSVYFDGEPLSYTNGSDTTDMNLGISSTSVTMFRPYMASSVVMGNSARERILYTDNWAFESYSADSDITLWNPPQFNPVSFVGITDGKRINTEDFNEITVSLGNETADRVELYINNEKIGEKDSSPYTFIVPENVKNPGSITLGAVAYIGEDAYEKTVKVSLSKSYSQLLMNEQFESYSSMYDAQNGGWYHPSSRMYNPKNPGGWFIEPMTVKDLGETSFGNSFRMGCAPSSDETFTDSNGDIQSKLTFGYQSFNKQNEYTVSGDKVLFDWYMYADNLKFSDFEMELGSTLFDWSADEGKLQWNVSPAKYTEVSEKKWQHYSLLIDISLSTPLMTLTLDEEVIFEKLPLSAPFSSFKRVMWTFVPDTNDGSYIAFDEVKLTHIVPRPGLGEVKFYIDDESTDDVLNVSARTNAISVKVDGGLIDKDIDSNVLLLENGEVLKGRDGNGDMKKSEVALFGDTLWIIPPRPLLKDASYTVRLKGDATFRDNAKIGYDQDIEFETSYHAKDVKKAEFFINGEKIDNISSANPSSGDRLKAKVTVINETNEDLYILFASYEENFLKEIKVIKAEPDISQDEKTFETEEIVIEKSEKFSASVAVWDNDFIPIAKSTWIK